MANTKNLKKGNPETQFKSGRNAVENGRKGGLASGKAKRAQRTMKEDAILLLSLALKDDDVDDVEDVQNLAELKGKNITVQNAIILAQVKKAIKGDRGAAEYLMNLSGNKPKEEVQLSGAVNTNPLEGLTTEELRKMVDNG